MKFYFLRLCLWLHQPYIRGVWWRFQIIRVRNYFRYNIFLIDIGLARYWLSSKIAGLT